MSTRRRHCWLRFHPHRFYLTGSVSLIPRGFGLAYGGALRRCKRCGWETTSPFAEEAREADR